MEILLGAGLLGIGGIGGIIGAPGATNLGGNIGYGGGRARSPSGAAGIARPPTGLDIGLIGAGMAASGRCGIIAAGGKARPCAAGGRYALFFSGRNNFLCY